MTTQLLPGQEVLGLKVQAPLRANTLITTYQAAGPDGRLSVVRVYPPGVFDVAALGALQQLAQAQVVAQSAGLVAPRWIGALDLAGAQPVAFVRDFVPGASFAQLGVIGPDQAGDIVRALFTALAGVHSTGLVLKNLKTTNVFQGPDGLVRFTDQGFWLDDATDARSFAYQAPEQHEGADPDARGDLFSAGLLVWELVVGQFPYAVNTPESCLNEKRKGASLGHVDSRWQPLLSALLAPRPEGRLATAAQALSMVPVTGAQAPRRATHSSPPAAPAPGREAMPGAGILGSGAVARALAASGSSAAGTAPDAKTGTDDVLHDGIPDWPRMRRIVLARRARSGNPTLGSGRGPRAEARAAAAAAKEEDEEPLIEREPMETPRSVDLGPSRPSRPRRTAPPSSGIPPWAPKALAAVVVVAAAAWGFGGRETSQVSRTPRDPAPPARPTARPGPTVAPAPTGPEMIQVAGGTASISGDDGEDRALTFRPFQIGLTEVTNAEFAEFVRAASYKTQGRWEKFAAPGSEKHPVRNVTLADAQAFCRWYRCRLPKSTEWEYAARGEDGRPYPWGPDLPGPERCVVGVAGPQEVGSLSDGRSPSGAFDMAGNVWEWCSDLEGSSGTVRGGGYSSTPDQLVFGHCRELRPAASAQPDCGFRAAR